MSFDLFSLFEGFTLVNWLWFISAIFIGSVPLYLQVKHYNRTKSVDYLLFASIFGLSAYIWFIGSILDRNVDLFAHKSIMITFYLLHFLIVLHALRLRWRKYPPLILYPSLFGMLLTELLAILSSWEFLVDIWQIEQIIGGIVHIWVGIILVYSYITLKPVIDSSRIQIVRKGFIIIGILVVSQGFFEAIGRFVFFGLELSEIFIGLAAAIYSFILCFIAIFYPESMLISHVQVIRAKELYEKVQEYQTKDIKEDKIISYLLLLSEKGIFSEEKISY